MTNEEVKERIEELAKDFEVDESIVWALYDIMPNELYDGIVTALEDYSEMIFLSFKLEGNYFPSFILSNQF